MKVARAGQVVKPELADLRLPWGKDPTRKITGAKSDDGIFRPRIDRLPVFRPTSMTKRWAYFAGVLAHLASVLRNGYAFGGAGMVPVSEVLKGTIRV